MSEPRSSSLVVGRIRGAFGVQGWVRVESFTDPAENVLTYQPWTVETRSGVVSLVPLNGRWHGPGLVVQLGTPDGGIVTDRDRALALTNADVRVERNLLPPPKPGEVYLADLLGMTIVSADGHRLGRIENLLDNGVQPVLDVGVEGGASRLLVPFVRDAIVSRTDTDRGEVHLVWTRDDALAE
ncbi:MAG: ribosome maturation factor RimM [Oceanococcaceae bacterium]